MLTVVVRLNVPCDLAEFSALECHTLQEDKGKARLRRIGEERDLIL